MTALSRAPSFETILQQFCHFRGLYLLGAGASAGLAPIGNGLYRILAFDFWRNGGGFRPDIPIHSPLVQKIIDSQIDCSQEEIWGRPIRSGTTPFPAAEMLRRLSNGAAQLHGMIELARSRHQDRVTDSYRVFRAFHPATILNYNHDGLASDQCGDRHLVVAAHGSIHPWFGSADAERLIRIARECDLSIPVSDLIMCEKESYDDAVLHRRLSLAGSLEPEFIAIIGYSFAKLGGGYDDKVSLDWFKRRFRNFAGPVYVINPWPDELEADIADGIRSPNVFGVRAWWNNLSHAFVMHLENRGLGQSIYATHEMLLWTHGDGCAFPLINL